MYSPGHLAALHVLLAIFCDLTFADFAADGQGARVKNERGNIQVDAPFSVIVTVTTTVQT